MRTTILRYVLLSTVKQMAIAAVFALFVGILAFLCMRFWALPGILKPLNDSIHKTQQKPAQ